MQRNFASVSLHHGPKLWRLSSVIRLVNPNPRHSSLTTFYRTVSIEEPCEILGLFDFYGHGKKPLPLSISPFSFVCFPKSVNDSRRYGTGFWIFPVPPQSFLKSRIYRNSGYFPGVCIRIDGKSVVYPISDPQQPVRRISLNDFNFQCQAGHYDVRLNQLPSFDPTIDANPIANRAYFCNGMPPQRTS